MSPLRLVELTDAERDGAFARVSEYMRECELLVCRLRAANAALRGRVAELEAENARLRSYAPVLGANPWQ